MTSIPNKYMKKDNVFVINQPKHAILSVVLVMNDYPIPQEVHKGIDRLCGYSDVAFIFSGAANINKEKFASLYEACLWIDSDYSIPDTVFKVLEYDTEIFKSHPGYVILNSNDIKDVDNSKKIIDLTASSVTYPIYKQLKYDALDYYYVYKELTCSNIFKRKKDIDKMHLTTTSQSGMYFKQGTINILLDYWRNSENNDFIHSFDSITQDIYPLFSSMIRHFGLEHIDADPFNLVTNEL